MEKATFKVRFIIKDIKTGEFYSDIDYPYGFKRLMIEQATTFNSEEEAIKEMTAEKEWDNPFVGREFVEIKKIYIS